MRKALLQFTVRGGISLALAIALASFLQPSEAHAAPTSSECFSFDSETETIVYYLYDGLICGPSVEIPPDINGTPVTHIGSNAFYQMPLTSVFIPNTVTSIGEYAFLANNLTSIDIPDSVTSIGDGAFISNQLESVTLPSSITSISGGMLYNNKLTSVTIPDSVTSIGINAFGFNKLTSVTIPDSVTSIGDSAFYDNALATITIPNSVTSIGTHAFRENELTNLTIPNSVTSIGEYTFYSNQLTSVEIPNTVSTIGFGAFANNKLISVILPNAITDIGEGAFSFNQLSSVAIPNSITSIKRDTFRSNKLTSIVIPNSVTSIGYNAFARNKISSVIIPNSVTDLGGGSFSDNLLTSVTIPSSITTINDTTFTFNKLTEVHLPSSIQSIDVTAFSAQNKWGGSADDGSDPNHDLYSGDLGIVQNVYNNMWYTRIYTSDGTNPHNLTDGIMSEWWWPGDVNQNGNQRDPVGGHLINPAYVKIQFKDTNGNQLRTPAEYTGVRSTTSNHLTNYSITTSGVVSPQDPMDPTPEEQAEWDAGFAQYYRAGQTKTFSAPAIAGYKTPSAKQISLTPGKNTITFTYAANQTIAPSPTPNNPSSPEQPNSGNNYSPKIISPQPEAAEQPATTTHPLNITVDDDIDLTKKPIISNLPTFSGKAKPGAYIVITVHSDPVTCETTADSEGYWSCTLATALPAGAHNVFAKITNPDNSVEEFGPYPVTVDEETTSSEKPLSDDSKTETVQSTDKSSNLHIPILGFIILLIAISGITYVAVRRKRS